jgi:flagellar hook-associated protein 2
MNITSAGIGSGLDLESIIEAFVTSESLPTEIRLQEKEDRVNTELSGLGSFKSSLSTFQTIINKLASIDDFNEQVIDASNDDISVSTNGFASNGQFSVEVLQLAQATKIQTPNFTDSSTTVGAGTLSLGSGDDSFDVIIDPSDDLSAIRDKINGHDDNFGVIVSLVNADAGTYLSYSTSKTGVANELTVTTADTALDDLSTNATMITSAQDAKIEIDGNLITHSTNEFKNSIEDVTIVANNQSASGAAVLDISQNQDVASSLIHEFVDGYNALVENMIGLAAPKFGRLAFDTDLRAMKGQLNDVVINAVSGLSGDIQSLNDIGVSLNKEGKLEISPLGIGTMDTGVEKLAGAIEHNIDEVGQLFASTDGVVSQLTELISNYNDSDGSLTRRQSFLNADLTSISDEYDALEERLRNYEDTLRSRFSFLDSTVAQYDATSSWLTTALTPVSKDS